MTTFTNTQNKYRSNRGFTLIELIVVIAIIALLASVVLASLGQSRNKAEIAKFQSDYRAVSSALELYRQSHSGMLPGIDAVPVVAISISDLIVGSLETYVKQTPSVSPAVVSNQFPDVYYYPNPTNGSARYWCGDTSSTQDYVLYFVPTQEAQDSGLFLPLLDSDGNAVGDYYCISVNQK